MIKLILITKIICIGISVKVCADKLPQEAKAILMKLEEVEKKELKSVEQEILRKKIDVLRTLERSEKAVTTEMILKRYALQIKKLKEQIKLSEAKIKNNNFDANKTTTSSDFSIMYGLPYHYSHPFEQFSEQKGELTIFKSGKAEVKHKNKEGVVVFKHLVPWSMIDGKIVVQDHVHGKMIISHAKRLNKERINVVWTRLGKSIRARIKK